MCPICKVHTAIIENKRPPGADTNNPDNIISRVLECGQEIGTEEFNKLSAFYAEELGKVATAKQKLDRELKDKIGAKWVEITGGKK